MERQVPVYSAGRKNPLAIRLADVPSLFSEGSEREQPVRQEPFWRLARFPARWNHLAEEKSRRFKALERVLVGKVSQLFRNAL